MLIDSSYFDTAERNIPNTGSKDVLSLLNSLIATHEKDYLIKVLGYELYKLFWAGITVATPDQRYMDIWKGADFTGWDQRTKRWEGLVSAIAISIDPPLSVPDSPIADYVYYWYLVGKVNHVSGTGQVQAKNQSSEMVSSAPQQVRAWNNTVEKTRVLLEFLSVNYTVYPEFQRYDSWGYWGYWGYGYWGTEVLSPMNEMGI